MINLFRRTFKLEGTGTLPDNWKKFKDIFRRSKSQRRSHETECDLEEIKPSTSTDNGQNNAGSEDKELKGFVDNILLGFLNNIKKFLQENEPVTIPALPPTSIEDENVKVNLVIKNLEIYKASSFKVNKLQNSIFQMTEAFNLTFPELEFHAQYEIRGHVLGSNVRGKGNAKIWMTNLVTWGKAYATLKRGKVQLKQLDLDYTLEKIRAKATGLKVSGKSDQEVEELLNSQLLAYFTKNEKLVCNSISRIVMENTNAALASMGITDILNWLLHFKPGQRSVPI